ncbi:MAG: sugar phosphate isomerase/epimerase [Acidobacteriota bacterium]
MNGGSITMMGTVTRREFSWTLAAGLGAASWNGASAQGNARRQKIGHTGITWGFAPKDAEQAIKDVASLGYYGYESFGNVLESWEATGGLNVLLDAQHLPLRSAYCPLNLTDTTKRTDEVAKLVRWAKLIKKCGGSVAVLGPNSVPRATYDFAAHKTDIVAALNDMGKALDGTGVIGALHQHTGTCIESRDETYAVMEAVDTRYVKFGPDVGQLQKGGSDPVKVVKDFQSVVHHVHLKDFDGGPDFLGYCPLGRGKVNVPAIVDLLETSGHDVMIMVELDPSEGRPMAIAPVETARISKQYLQTLGYTFR